MVSPVLYALGIRQAIEWFAEQLSQQYGLQVRVEEDEQAEPLQEDRRALLFRCVRELLLNVVKHAQASTATVGLDVDGDSLRITVGDDGCGFDVSELATPRGHAGFGLFSIRERLRFVGGELGVESRLGGGTRCIMTVPGDTAAGSSGA